MKRIRARRRPGDEPPQRLADALAHAEVRQPSYRACPSCGRETCWIGARHARAPERSVRPFPPIERTAARALTPEVLAAAIDAVRNAPVVPAFTIVDEAHYLPPAYMGHRRLIDVFAFYRERKDP